MFEAKILHVEVVRAYANGVDTGGGLAYTMLKNTPFGMMSAQVTYPEDRVMKQGIEALDGAALQELSREINNEETSRYLEAGANSYFGNALQA